MLYIFVNFYKMSVGKRGHFQVDEAQQDAPLRLPDISVIFKDAGGGFIFANKVDKGDGNVPENIPAETIAKKTAAGTYDGNTFTRADGVEVNQNVLTITVGDKTQNFDLTTRGGAKNHRKSKKRIHRKRRRTMNKK
jgi:hypothetical protein